MIELFPLLVLFISGILTSAFGWFKVGKYGTVISAISFVLLLHQKPGTVRISWFSAADINFDLTFNFFETEIFLCLVITAILVCLYLARSISFFDQLIERKFGILNLFVFFMCVAILADNIFQFYIGIEALGLISSFLVGIEKNAKSESTKVFLFNKFASILFLVATSLLVIETKSYDISEINKACLTSDSYRLFLPTCLLLVSCLCKGAQLPFSYWLLEAVKANTFASILIHAGTIVAVGIIFIAKFYFLFECFPSLKNVMVAFGACTAFWVACCSLAHTNIKKIIACLTSSSSGLMFIACGVGGYSLAILYFVCHAFFKSMLFLSFAYLIAAMSDEKDIGRMGGVAKFAPKVTDLIWTAFLCSSGFPLLPGFCSKLPFAGTLDMSGMSFLSIGIIAVSVVSVIAIFRMLYISLYGETKADELTLSRSSKSNTYDMSSFWILTSISVLGTFIIWSIFEWGRLHLGFAGTVYVCDTKEYLFEAVTAVLQIAASIILFLWYRRYSKNITQSGAGIAVSLFKKNEIYEFCSEILMRVVILTMNALNQVQQRLAYFLNVCLFKSLYQVGICLVKNSRRQLQSHLVWILVGMTFVFVITFLRGALP